MDKKEQIMTLWRQSFHDPEDFIHFYFDQKYSDTDSLVYEENGKALSAFLMLPYPMTWEGTTIATSYISGACTLPEARNQGLMTLLLRAAFAEMHKKHIALSTLIPAEEWLFHYYAKQGYAPVFEYSVLLYTHQPSVDLSGFKIICPESYDEKAISGLFPYFERKMQERPCCIQHPLVDYQTLTREHYMSGGKLLVILSGQGQPEGVAFVMPEDDRLLIKEILYDSEAAQSNLLEAIARKWETLPVYYRMLPQVNHTERYGMARITDALTMLRHIAQASPTISLCIKINDPQLPANDGIFLLSEGQCNKITNGNPDIETDIPTLTEALLGYRTEQLPLPLSSLFNARQPYMSLMID